MKWLIVAVATFALLADVGAATAQKKSNKGYSGSHGPFVQRSVSWDRYPSTGRSCYPVYPQSPPGIGGG
jgi:hypothetical protein